MEPRQLAGSRASGSLMPVVRRMRRRVQVAWGAQMLLLVGLLLTLVTAAAVRVDDWSFVAVMTILLVVGLALWVRFAFGLALLLANFVYLLVATAMALVDPGGLDPVLLVRRIVTVLWLVGGLAGIVALVASTRRAGDARDDIDTVAY